MKKTIMASIEKPNLKIRQPLNGFTDVDGQLRPQLLVEYLDLTNTNPTTKSLKQIVVTALNPAPGDYILEVGCGVGHMALDLAGLVGPLGRVAGVDCSVFMIAEAKKRAHEANSFSIDFRVEDAHRLSFPDDTFDGGMTISTLIHVANPRQVLAELFRVIKPGKCIAVQEGDWDTMVFSTGNSEVDGLLVSVLRKTIRNGGVAHQLPTLMQVLGFTEIAIGAGTFMVSDIHSANDAWKIWDSIEEARETKLITPLQADTILDTLHMAEQNGEFFGAVTGFVATGKKPP